MEHSSSGSWIRIQPRPDLARLGRSQDKHRDAKGTREGENTPAPARVTLRGPRGKPGSQDAAPRGASVSLLLSLLAPWAIFQGRGSVEQAGDQGRPG